MTDGTLLRPVNITNLLLQNSYIIIMALGMLLVIVAGHIDLSVGSVVGFVGALAAVMMVNWEWSIYLTIPACLLVGILIGAAQGYWIAYWRIPVLHRDACRDAGVSRRIALAARRPVGRTVPAAVPGAFDGFIPDLLPFVKTLFGVERMNGQICRRDRAGDRRHDRLAGLACGPAIAPTAWLRSR
jgi:putative multiple sugar transport system permease protein